MDDLLINNTTYCVMWYITSHSPALSFSWRKERSRDVEVRRLTEGNLVVCFLSVSDLSPAMTASGEMATE